MVIVFHATAIDFVLVIKFVVTQGFPHLYMHNFHACWGKHIISRIEKLHPVFTHIILEIQNTTFSFLDRVLKQANEVFNILAPFSLEQLAF